MRAYHPTQAAYLAARALVDTLRADLAAIAPKCPDTDDNAILDAYEDVYEACRETLGMARAESALVAAESALVNWSLDCAASVAKTPADLETIELCRTRGLKSWKHRPTLIDTAMRLAA